MNTMVQDKQSEKRTFNKLAVDEHYGGAAEYEYEEIYTKLLGSIIESDGQFLLDVGCGPAIHGSRLKNRGYSVFGIDISYEAAKKAKETGRLKGVVVGDIEALPFKQEAFDICFCGCVLHHFPDITLTAKDLFRITKAGKSVVSFDPNAHHPVEYFHGSRLTKILSKGRITANERSLSVYELEKAFLMAGFTNIEFQTSQAYTKREKIYHKHVKPIIFKLIQILFKGYHKNNMLLMKAKK